MAKLNWNDNIDSSQVVIGPFVLDVYRPRMVKVWYCMVNGDRVLEMQPTMEAAKVAVEESLLRVCEAVVARLSPPPAEF